MDQVYSKASRVIIWLSPSPETDPYLAVETLAELYNDLCKGIKYDRLTPDRYKRRQWNSLIQLLGHAWFRRTWTFQEAVLSSMKTDTPSGQAPLLERCLTVLYGTVSLPWAHLYVVARDLLQPEYRAVWSNVGAEVLAALEHIREIWHTRVRLVISNMCSLEYALMATRHRQATNARDAIYGLLGISTDAEGFGIEPDYSDTVESVYQRFAFAMICHAKSLRLLSFAGCGYPGSVYALPSWVPDWTCPPKCSPLSVTEGSRKYRATRFAASCTLDSEITTALSVKGVIFDKIEYLSSICTTSTPNPELNEWLDEVESLVIRNNSRNTCDTQLDLLGTPAFENFCRTLTGNYILENGELRNPSADSLRQKYLSCKSSCATRHGLEPSTRFCSSKRLDELAMPESSPVMGPTVIFSNALEPTVGRRLCVTEAGRIGLIPPLSKQGDVLCVLLGAKVPFILRQSENCQAGQGPQDARLFKLVGESYIHGAMGGEIAVSVDRGEMQYGSFLLQ
ncbi:hypothetical protein NA57DRAFT_77390 [Rhizodiscina lignyota]|uniref:Heterokaryon incompatibility domain-containing protein n=1 Tax=Rhizodiscina lignyota TaxID=1504668 RepID=A0A9P4M4S8_9PEZI|nr:hypothetical protein NA57DRAFT_77390 [Rhizodiscina lignyota]